MGRTRRRTGKIDRLPLQTKDEVEQMILSGVPYREIVDYLKDKGVELSRMAVCTYAKKFLATAQMVHIAQENFRMLTDELDRHPELDTTEGIIRLMSNSVLNTLASTAPEDWQKVGIDKLMHEANALVKVAAYKKRVEAQNQDVTEAGLDAVKALVFEAMSRKDPALFEQVRRFLEAEKDAMNQNAGQG